MLDHENQLEVLNLTPSKNELWRVCWFGCVDYFDGEKRRSEPTIEVFLAPLKEHNGEVNHLKPSSVVLTRTHSLRVPVEYLAFLRLGDIWKNGQFFQPSEEHHHVRLFRDLKFTPSLSQKAKVSSRIQMLSSGEKEFLLPFHVHPYHRLDKEAFCEIIDTEDNIRLIIPHVVIIQAYFSSDHFILRQAFQFGADLSALYDENKTKFDTNRKSGFIHLRKHVFDKSAGTVARIAFSEKFRGAYQRVSRSLAYQSQKGFALTPITHMPITESEGLQVTGQWFKNLDETWSFFVFQILSCESELPYSELEYFRDNPGDKNLAAGKINKEGKGGLRKNSQTQDSREEEANVIPDDPNAEPNNRYEEIMKRFPLGTQHIEIARTSIRKTRQEEHKNDEQNPRGLREQDPEQTGAGSGNSSEDTASLVEEQDNSEHEDSYNKDTKQPTFTEKFNRINLFLAVLTRLSAPPYNLQFEFVSSENRPDGISFFPSVPLPSRDSTWDNMNYLKSKAKYGHQTYQPRQVLGVSFVLKGQQRFYLFEAERRMRLARNGWYEMESPALYMIYTGSKELSNRQLGKIFEQPVRVSNQWSLPEGMQVFPEKSIRHPSHETIGTEKYVEIFSKNIYTSIFQLLGID